MNRTLSATFERAASDKTARTVQAVLSTETPVNRGGVFEVLTHTSASIDLSRFPLPVIINHDSYSLPIAVAENPTVTGGKLRATIRFSESEQATQIFNDVVAGIVTNLSVGYQHTNSHEETREGQAFLIVDNWTPYELSVVAVPADANAGFNKRNFNPTTQDKNMTIDVEKIKNDAINTERERVAEIRSLCSIRFLPDHIGNKLADKFIAEGKSIDECRILVNEEMVRISQNPETSEQYFQRTGNYPLSNSLQHTGNGIYAVDFLPNNNQRNSSFGHLERAISDALMMRANIRVENPSPAARDFKSTSLTEMAKILLSREGKNTAGNPEMILQRAYQTSSDWVGILDNIQGKALATGYEMQESTIDAWTKLRETDFLRDQTIVNIGSLPSLEKILEHGEYTTGFVDSVAEKITIGKYGRIWSVSFESLIKDDLGAFLMLPERFGQSARRKEASLVYATLTSNPVLSDGIEYFHSSRGNVSTTPAAISIESLGAARSKMRLYKDVGGLDFIDAVPKILLCPVALETKAQQIVSSITPTKSSDVTPDWIKNLVVISDPRLDADSELDYYLIADPAKIEGMARVHLGEPVTIDSKEEFIVDGISWKCRMLVGCGLVDPRAMYKVIGA